MEKCGGRHTRGKELYYEVAWETLDVKQNTYEPLSKLKRMGAEGMAKAYDCRAAAQGAGGVVRCVAAAAQDLALELSRLGLPASFDRVLVDAPCSGMGVARKRPAARREGQTACAVLRQPSPSQQAEAAPAAGHDVATATATRAFAYSTHDDLARVEPALQHAERELVLRLHVEAEQRQTRRRPCRCQ
mgnify:CR=1 FL=1